MAPDTNIDPRVRRTHADVSRAAAELLLEHGWDHVTHAHVAERAGYARTTIYKHWPERPHLLRAAFRHMGEMPHGTPTGDLRDDLVSELEAFRHLLVDVGFARPIVALADRASTSEEVADLRDEFLGVGQELLRARVKQAVEASGRSHTNVEAATDMLSGALVYRIAIMGRPVEPSFVEAIVEVFISGLGEGDD